MILSFLARNLNHCCSKVLSAITPAGCKPRWTHMDFTHNRNNYSDQKIVVIMGPTGSGKSRLSVDLATRFFPSEIINSDKMQVYRGLDITTNKIPMRERLGVPHHLLGQFDPEEPEVTPFDFRSFGAAAISGISSRRKLPLIVGGSNSFIYALLVNRFDSESNVFDCLHPDPVSTELRYNCCFLWVDVSLPVLNQYLSKRVDDMLDSGMFNEIAEFFNSEEHNELDSVTRSGLRKAIGLPEFEKYFKTFPPGASRPIGSNPQDDVLYDEAVWAIKQNTCHLAKRQVGKILRLRDAGWDLRRFDATEAFRAVLSDSGRWSDIWERQIVQPSMKIVKQFLKK